MSLMEKVDLLTAVLQPTAKASPETVPSAATVTPSEAQPTAKAKAKTESKALAKAQAKAQAKEENLCLEFVTCMTDYPRRV